MTKPVTSHDPAMEQLLNHDILNPASVTKLAQRFKELNGEGPEAKEILDQLVRAHLRFIKTIVDKYPHHKVDPDDLIMAGAMAVRKSALKYDPKRGTQFTTVLFNDVRSAIQKEFYNQVGARTDEAYDNQDVSGVAETRRKASKAGSLNRISNGGEDLEIGDMLEDPREKAPGNEMEQSELNNNLIERLQKALRPRELKILSLRNGIGVNHAYSLQEVADELKITRERVRQLESRALEKAKSVLQGTVFETLFGAEISD